MSGIPAWAYRGAKVVLIDASPSRFGGDTWVKDSICEILATKMIEGHAACRVRVAASGWEHAWDEWARLSRFRPLVTLEDDMAAHFAHLLTTPVREGV